MATFQLPSGVAVKYRGMRGREEEILTNPKNHKKLQSGEAWNEVMAACTEALGTLAGDEFQAEKEVVQVSDILRLTTPDRDTLTWLIRRASYGDQMEAEVVCGSCGTNQSVSVDLSVLPIRPIPDDYTPDRGFTGSLHDGEKVRKFEFNYMDGKKESQLSRTTENFLTMAMLARLGDVEGIDHGDRKAWLLNLPIQARRTLRSLMAEKDAGVDYARATPCESCLEDVAFNCQLQRGFFFPPAQT